jgi:hypothetical protein
LSRGKLTTWADLKSVYHPGASLYALLTALISLTEDLTRGASVAKVGFRQTEAGNNSSKSPPTGVRLFFFP